MILLLLSFAFVSHPHVRSGTLVIIAKSADAIVIAADGLGTPGGKQLTKGPAEKIFPVGNLAACMMVGAVIVESNSGKKDLNFPQLIRDWTDKHPNAMIREAYTSLAAEMFTELKRFFGAEPDRGNVTFSCVGYENRVPRILNTDFLIVGTEVKKTERDRPLGTGVFMPFGFGDVSKAITGGYAPMTLVRFSNAPAVQKYKKRPAEMTTQDFVDLARVCEEATQSPEGRVFDPNAKYVGGPNRFAIITGQHGFKWLP